MKTLFKILSLFLIFSCTKKENVKIDMNEEITAALRTATTYDYKSTSSGFWSDPAIWVVYDSSIGDFVPAQTAPGKDNNVFLAAGLTVELSGDAECKDIFFNTTQDVIRFHAHDYTLNVWGQLGLYEQLYNDNQYIFSSGILNYISTGTNGYICFKGDLSRTIIDRGKYNANNTNCGWNAKIDFSPGAIAFIDDRVRIENVIVESGVLQHREQLRLGTNYPDNIADSTVNGTLIVKSGAALIAGYTYTPQSKPLVYKNANYPCDSIVFESGSSLILQNNYDIFARHYINDGTVFTNSYNLNIH